MTNPTVDQHIDDVDRARVTALMEYAARANLAADVRHADGSDYTEPAVLLAGSQTYVYFDDAGRLHISVWPDDMNWPLTRPDGAIPVRVDIEGGLVWTGEIPRETSDWAGGDLRPQAPAEPATTGGHPVDALSPDAQNDLLRRIFNVLEHGNPLGQGPAGVETGSDHLQEIDVLFADRGITFTNPDDAAAEDAGVKGCPCGEADYGAPGHDGGDPVEAAPDADPEEIALAKSPAWQAFQAEMGAWVGDDRNRNPADA